MLDAINEAICDNNGRPLQNIRIRHTIILDDPYPDPAPLLDHILENSPEPVFAAVRAFVNSIKCCSVLPISVLMPTHKLASWCSLTAQGARARECHGHGHVQDGAATIRSGSLCCAWRIAVILEATENLCESDVGEVVQDDRMEDDWVPTEDTRELEEIERETREQEAKNKAVVLEMIGDLPEADAKPPPNMLFICKLNPVTTEEVLIHSMISNCLTSALHATLLLL